jgi:hypothetical protein
MFTYATILIGSIVVALVALVVYRVVMGSSRSILSSKEPISLVSSTAYPRANQAPLAVADAPAWPGEKIHATPGSMAGAKPAKPSENTDWDWQTKENKVSAQQAHHATGTANTRHCSLYDVDPTAPPANRSDVWPHREEKLESAGKAYKVTRKMPPQASNDGGSGKPWGW